MSKRGGDSKRDDYDRAGHSPSPAPSPGMLYQPTVMVKRGLRPMVRSKSGHLPASARHWSPKSRPRRTRTATLRVVQVSRPLPWSGSQGLATTLRVQVSRPFPWSGSQRPGSEGRAQRYIRLYLLYAVCAATVSCITSVGVWGCVGRAFGPSNVQRCDFVKPPPGAPSHRGVTRTLPTLSRRGVKEFLSRRARLRRGVCEARPTEWLTSRSKRRALRSALSSAV